METVNIHDAKTSFSRLVDRAHAGEEIIVAKAGKPWARLVPLEHMAERRPGRYKEEVPEAFFDPLPEEELDAWHR